MSQRSLLDENTKFAVAGLALAGARSVIVLTEPEPPIIYGTDKDDVLNGTDGDDVIIGLKGDDQISGGAGGDALYGSEGGDWLNGGAGNDTLSGGEGSDTYVFGLGSGQDQILDSYHGAETDRVLMAPDVSASDVTLARNEYDLILSIKGTTDQLKISGFFYYAKATLIDYVEFSDGTVWDADYLLEQIGATQWRDVMYGTSGADVLNGLGGDDHLDGLGGADMLIGGRGDDTINGGQDDDQLHGDAGNDDMEGGGGNDFLFGGTGDDWLVDRAGNNQLSGGAGNDVLRTLSGNDTLDGGTGNDSLDGGSGNDTYLFGLGSGKDRVYDTYDDGGNDRIIFGAGIAAGDVTMRRESDSLILSIKGTNDQLFVGSYFWLDSIDHIEFADGTVWNESYVRANIHPTKHNDKVVGTAGDDVLNGLGGDDEILGDAGNDTLNGGAGNDALAGGDGNDTYLFGIGSGTDIIDNADYSNGFDRLLLKAGITADDIALQRSSNTLVVSIKGTSDKVWVVDHFNDYFPWAAESIDAIEFADGTVWDVDDILSHVKATEGDDTLTGTSGNDVLNGLEGNDELNGLAGNDTLNGGFGIDRLDGDEGADMLRGGADPDELDGDTGNDVLLGGAGNDILYGGLDDDVLNGGTGNDHLNGDDGNDVFVFDVALGAKNVDYIEGYELVDTIWLDNSVFSQLTAEGVLNADFFVSNARGQAQDANDYIVFDSHTHELYYDADGSGTGGRVKFAVVFDVALAASEFVIF